MDGQSAIRPSLGGSFLSHTHRYTHTHTHIGAMCGCVFLCGADTLIGRFDIVYHILFLLHTHARIEVVCACVFRCEADTIIGRFDLILYIISHLSDTHTHTHIRAMRACVFYLAKQTSYWVTNIHRMPYLYRSFSAKEPGAHGDGAL